MSWQRGRELFAIWGWALLAVAGLLLGGVGLGLGASLGFTNPWTTVSLSFAQAILSAGMVTGVLRAAQQAGFFKDQLREVIYADSLSGSLIDAKSAWRNLTRGLFRQRFASLSNEVLDGLSIDSLIGTAEYFYESHWRQIDIDWANRETGLLKIVERISATLRTADIGRDIRFINVYDPEADDSKRPGIEYTLSDGNAFNLKFTKQDVKQRADGKSELVANLPPASQIFLRRGTVKFQNLQSDPFLNFRSTCLFCRTPKSW